MKNKFLTIFLCIAFVFSLTALTACTPLPVDYGTLTVADITVKAGENAEIAPVFSIEKYKEKPFDVKNPVVDEILTEKWHEGTNYQEFLDMMKSLTVDITALQRCSNNSEVNSLTKKMFGEKVTNAAIIRHAQILNESRQSGKLSVDQSGTLNTKNSGVLVKKNTFYGN